VRYSVNEMIDVGLKSLFRHVHDEGDIGFGDDLFDFTSHPSC
jgi:hypothetical protein